MFSMHQATTVRPSGSEETVFPYLARFVRCASLTSLRIIALTSGFVALLLQLLGHGDWRLLIACYVLWSIATWGLVFSHRTTRTWLGRIGEGALVVSATLASLTLMVMVLYWALGPKWQL